jgi:hypothetical protein
VSLDEHRAKFKPMHLHAPNQSRLKMAKISTGEFAMTILEGMFAEDFEDEDEGENGKERGTNIDEVRLQRVWGLYLHNTYAFIYRCGLLVIVVRFLSRLLVIQSDLALLCPDIGGGSGTHRFRFLSLYHPSQYRPSRSEEARIPLRWMIRECFKMDSRILFRLDRLQTVNLDPNTLYPEVSHRPEALPLTTLPLRKCTSSL